MAAISMDDGRVEVEAALVAAALKIEVEALRDGLRRGAITTLCERGEGEDAGRMRLTFFAPGRRLRIVVDAEGRVIRTTTAAHRGPTPSGGAV